jgi:hypothetical protein
MFAPIAIFTYNRPEHFRQTVRYLLFNAEARESDLYIFSDGARNEKDNAIVDEIRAYASGITGFRNVFMFPSEMNLGLKASIKKGISHVLSKHESVIVMEDDICVNSNFLNYHNQCLALYAGNRQIWSVSGFVIPEIGRDIEKQTGQKFFLTQRASSWGWSTWKDRWEKAEWNEAALLKYLMDDGNYGKYYKTGGDKIRMLLDRFEQKNNSWAIIWDFNHFMNGTFCLYPCISFIRNIGLDYSGVHSKPRAEYDVELENWDFNGSMLPEKPASSGYAIRRFSKINKKFYRDILDLIRFRSLRHHAGK